MKKRSWFGGDLNLLLVDHWETLLPLGQGDSVDFEQYFRNLIPQKNQIGIPVYFCLEQKRKNQSSSQCPSFLLAQSLGVKRIMDFQFTGCALD